MRRWGTLLALCAVVAGCPATTTNLVRTWREPTYTGRDVKKVLVIGLTPNQSNRKVYEYALAARLQEMRYQPLASIDVLPKDRMADKETVAAVIQQYGIQVVLVSRLVSVQSEVEYVPPVAYAPPPGYYGFYPYYAGGYTAVYSPGYVNERQVVYLETNAYDAQQEKLVWSGISKTFDYSSIEGVSASVADTIARALVDQGVL